MAKKKQPQTGNEQKVQTKYERKMEQRRKQEERDKREAKILRIGATIVGVLLVAVIVGSIAYSVMNKRAIMKDAYITVGDYEVTKLEYDYYYNTSLNSYSSILSYMGMDASTDLASEQYSEDMTWKDLFDQTAVEQIKQTKALIDDAAANGFTYDTTEDYETTINNIQSSAETAGLTIEQYYKAYYGDYATKENMEPFIKEGLLASAYYNHLKEENVPTEQEIKDYYEANVQNYDRVDYRSFTVTADVAKDASEEDTDRAMMDAKNKADAMMEARQGGADFKELCLENASEEEKATYEDTQTDASLREGAYYSSTTTLIGDWLYEEGRTEGDIAVIEDMTNHQYYVVEFISRYYDEADDENISSTISSNRASEYLNGLRENYEVTAE